MVSAAVRSEVRPKPSQGGEARADSPELDHVAQRPTREVNSAAKTTSVPWSRDVGLDRRG